jgi:hypothetical protein
LVKVAVLILAAFVLLALKETAPGGWHVPTDAEWTTLSTNLGGNMAAFSGLLGGFRGSHDDFQEIGVRGIWWSATEMTSGAYTRSLSNTDVYLYRDIWEKYYGFSVRLVKGN